MRKSNQDVPTGSSPRLRCAIYTRKSTEEGLEQEFNSLDAQREAAEAFIHSQRREGWIALPQLYDDFRQSKRVNWIVWWCIKSTV